MIAVRAAVPADRRIVFEWAIAPLTRAMSFNTAPILWEDHCRWFDAKLDDPATRLLILEHDGRAAGQARFDLADERATISVALAPGARGRGLSTPAIIAALAALPMSVTGCDAFIKPDNTRSIRAFERAGFTERGGDDQRRHYVLDRATSDSTTSDGATP